MTPLLFPSVAFLCTLTVSQTVRGQDSDWLGGPAAIQEVTTDPVRRPAQCRWRLDAASVWECRLDGGVETALVRPDYRATELRLFCEDWTPGRLRHGMFQQASKIRRLEIRDCGVTRIEERALHRSSL